MKKYKNLLYSALFSTLCFSLFAGQASETTQVAEKTLFMRMVETLFFSESGQAPDFIIFMGRHHPLLLHLPVGLLVVIAFLEVFSWWRKVEIYDDAMYVLLWLAALSSIGTVFLGCCLALQGGYNQELLSTHGWLGIAVAFTAIIALYLKHHYRRNKSLQRRHVFRVAVFIACGIMSFAGHDGGSLTHGTEYLFEFAPNIVRKMTGRPIKTPRGAVEKDSKKLPYFEVKVLPILKKRCVKCHGPEKMKGKVRLDSLLAIMRRHDKMIKPGLPQESKLYSLLVTEDVDDIMPPKGEGNMNDGEREIIRKWILAGASFSDKELKMPSANAAAGTQAVETPATIPEEAIETPKEAIETPKEAIETPKEAVETPKEAAGNSDKEFFHSKIMPIFEAKCYKCHGEEKDKGDLRLHTVEFIKASFEEEVIVPGDLDKSSMHYTITTDDEDDVMPPLKAKNPLTDEEIKLINEWIKNGAKGLE